MSQGLVGQVVNLRRVGNPPSADRISGVSNPSARQIRATPAGLS